MAKPDYPTEDNPEEGPDCQKCGTTTNLWCNQLSDDEHTVIIDCPDCDFQIETESNLAHEARKEQYGCRYPDSI